MKLTTSMSLLSCVLIADTLAAREVSVDVEVLEQREVSPVQSDIEISSTPLPPSDAAELLANELGVSVARKGGKGYEPIIRGQQQSQLNVLMGGSYIYGACPGRMDPPTTYAPLSGYDKIRILKGYETVIYGAGGPGGTVLFERNEPVFEQGKSITGHINGDYADNSQHQQLSADISTGSPDTYLRAYGQHQQAENYKDGHGHTVSSAFKSNSGGLLLSSEIAPLTRVELNVEATRDDDIYYSGSGMDAPWSKADIWRLNLKHDQQLLNFDAVEFSAWHSDVQHLMDNYSVRIRKPDNPLGMSAPSSSKTLGGRAFGHLYFQGATMILGADFQLNDRDAKRYQVDRATGEKTWQSHMWPGVEYQQVGLFSELDKDLGPQDTMRIGLRFDDLRTEASKANVQTLADSSPNSLYQKYYGYTADKVHEQNVSGLVAWQHLLTDHQSVEVRASRSVRSADATERYIASRGSCCHGSDDWVGNPKIKPEQHHQLDLGYQLTEQNYQLSLVVYIDEVTDYIIRQESESGALLYSNTRARLFGADTQWSYSLGHWYPSVGISWVQADDLTHNEPLPQIPPLTADLGMDYKANKWLAGVRWTLAASQNRTNTSSGLDAGDSSGYGVVHLHSKYQLNEHFTLQGGVRNLFDKAYAQHVNRASRDPFNPQASRVNEPGREIWLGLQYQL